MPSSGGSGRVYESEIPKLETVSSCSVCCRLEKEANPQLTTATLQEVVECDKVTSESPFLQAKQPQLPQSFFVRLVLQAPHQPRCPPLDTLKHLNVLPKLRGPELDTILKVWPHQCRVQGKNDLPAPAGHTIPDPGQVPLALLATWAHCWPMFSCCHQYPQVPFLLGTVQPHHPQPITLQGVTAAKVQDSALGLTKLHLFRLCPSVQLFQVFLQSPSSFQQVDTHSQLNVICKFTNEKLHAFIHVISKNIEQSWPQHRPLRDTTGDWPQLDAAPFTITLWVRPSSQFLTQQRVLLSKPRAASLFQSMLWETMSKALLKSK
ncbi:hypothetical protein DUI87_06908 [Hirundo rustica rustica]|uniref:Uncharacterized protein n=1 Tax=Hirundo rustica rustica TaxID=333673 RepID=A0A3M0KTK8_HIRRU|nr:hypothetical protein DUI87_06908 [Hirundo rustica rustica]